MKVRAWMPVVGGTLAVILGASTLRAASVIDNWASVKAPPAPELKPVKVDAKTTALLIFDLVKPFCNPQRYTRCPGIVPAVKKLISEARANGMMVVYTSVPPVPKSDIVDELTPTANDHFVQSGTDKFLYAAFGAASDVAPKLTFGTKPLPGERYIGVRVCAGSCPAATRP